MHHIKFKTIKEMFDMCAKTVEEVKAQPKKNIVVKKTVIINKKKGK